ncbi:MAG: hypothetical protein WBD10_16370 [Acidobacteriaceae bacterium]
MTQAERTVYEQAARGLGSEIQAGNAAAVRANTVAAVAAKFDPLAASIAQAVPEIQKATLTVDTLYNLKATDLQAGAGNAEFFCAVPNSSLVVTVTIPELPPGNYLLAVLHATGVENPRQISMILENEPAGSAQWKLAGLYIRPLTEGGHDGLWYWKQARVYAGKKQNWNAYFYYQTAAFLLNPVDFLSSPNLQKLEKEMQGVKPAALPEKTSLTMQAGGQSLAITGLRTDSFGGGLDLVVDYKAQGVSGPVETRTQIVELMKALLAKYPELRTGFHGLWVYAHYEQGGSFAIELPMGQIE